MNSKTDEQARRALERLERYLPLRRNQLALPVSLRRFHQQLLRAFPGAGGAPDSLSGVSAQQFGQHLSLLIERGIAVGDAQGRLTGAYPFTAEARIHKIDCTLGAARAMCAFDALAISPMLGVPVTIHSRCRVSDEPIHIEQHGRELQVKNEGAVLYAGIDWAATDPGLSCSASLCAEMVFILGEENLSEWHEGDPDNREIFSLETALELTTALFCPMMSEDVGECEHLSDADFVSRLEDKSLEGDRFGHRAHIRLAWLYLRDKSFSSACEDICRNIRAFAESQGAYDKFHETLTIASMHVIRQRMKNSHHNFDDFLLANPELVTDFVSRIHAHYRAEILATPAAQAGFVSPDRLAFV